MIKGCSTLELCQWNLTFFIPVVAIGPFSNIYLYPDVITLCYSVAVMTQTVQTNGVQPLSKTWELSLYELQRTPQVMPIPHNLVFLIYMNFQRLISACLNIRCLNIYILHILFLHSAVSSESEMIIHRVSTVHPIFSLDALVDVESFKLPC